jgi:zinc-ribbon domain
MSWHLTLRIALCLSMWITSTGSAPSQDRKPTSKHKSVLSGLLGQSSNQLAFAQEPKPETTKKRKSKAGTLPVSGMPAGYPMGNPNANSKTPPAGSSMQPPKDYTPSGIPTVGGGKPGTNPPPGSSLQTNFGSMPGYGTSGPALKPGTPPPGSALGINSGMSGKPSSYPVGGAKQTGPPPGSSMMGPSQAYVDKAAKMSGPPPEPIAANPPAAKPPAKAPTPVSQVTAKPTIASRLMSEFKNAYCSNCNKEVSDKDTKCPHCGAAFDEVVNADGTRVFLKPRIASSSALSSPNAMIFAVGIGLAISFFAFLIGIISVLVKKQGHAGT